MNPVFINFLFDKATGDIIDSGLITCELSDSAVTSATIAVPPSGLSNNDYGIAPVRNSNGLSVLNVQAAAGIQEDDPRPHAEGGSRARRLDRREHRAGRRAA